MKEYPIGERVLPHILDDKAQEHGERVFLRGDAELSYRELRDRAARLAGGLYAHGVTANERVLTMLPNITETVVAFLGIAWAGAVSVPVNTGYRGPLLRYIIDDADAQMLIIHPDYIPVFQEVVGDLAHQPRIVVVDDRAETTDVMDEGFISWDELAQDHAAVPAAEVSPGDLQAIMYTSGTTGPSKGVMVPYHCAYQYANPCGTHLVGERDVVYVTLPLFHIGGLWAGIYAALLADGQAVLKKHFSVSEFWLDVDRYEVTQTILLGVMAEYIAKQPPTPTDATHSLVRATVAPAPRDAVKFAERFGLRISQGWGLTETGCVTAPPAFGEPAADPSLCGRLRDDLFELQLVDDGDQPVPAGVPGQALVRSKVPNVLMSGYWRKPEATVEAWRDLWLHTGDVLVETPGGFYRFVDRQKDCIRRRGENISSMEVELAVLTHPKVQECAAIPVPDEDSEEEVKIAVTLTPDARLAPADLSMFLEGKLPRFMVPRYIEILEEIPKTPTQKVQKEVLRKAGVGAAWDRMKPS